MKQYGLAITFLAIVALGSIASTLLLAGKWRESVAACASSERALEEKRAEQTKRIEQLAERRRQVSDAQNYAQTWEPYLARMRTLADVVSGVDTEAQKAVVAIGNRSTPDVTMTFEKKDVPVQAVRMDASGDYARLVNWLGAVEAAYPAALVWRVGLEQRDKNMAMAVTLYIPPFIKR